jgi:hypothetical protein
MNKILAFAFTVCILLAFVLGALLVATAARSEPDHAWRDAQLDRVEVERAQNWARLELYAGCALAGVAIALVAGAGWAVVMWLNKKATTIEPTPAGYPLIVRRLGPPWLNKALLIFDPNRAPYPATVATGGPTVQVLQLPAPGMDTAGQVKVTSQAQAVQAIAAAALRGRGPGIANAPAAFAALPSPRPTELPPLLAPGDGMVDPLLVSAVEADWEAQGIEEE